MKKEKTSSSKQYWIERYNKGGGPSGGSEGELAKFKADFINDFVRENDIKTMFDLGCGDGNQAMLFDVKYYFGFEISPIAISKCRKKCCCRDMWFYTLDEIQTLCVRPQLTISMEVIVHLFEEMVFEDHMNLLFNLTTDYVIIYAPNDDINPKGDGRIKHRIFTEWVKAHKKEFSLRQVIKNIYPWNPEKRTGSTSDFYIFKRIN